MSLFIDRTLRESLREVMEWEKQNPDIVAHDARIALQRAEKAKADLIKQASMPTTHAPKTKRSQKANKL